MAKARPDEPDGRAAQRFRQVEPRKHSQQTRQDVNDHRIVERLHLVEENFGARFCQRAGKIRNERRTIIRQGGIEGGDISLFEARLPSRRKLSTAGGILSPFAASSKAVPTRCQSPEGFCGGTTSGAAELGHIVEPLQVGDEGVENSLVVFLPGLLRADGGDARRNQILIIGQFLFPVLRVLRLEGVFELLRKAATARRLC